MKYNFLFYNSKNRFMEKFLIDEHYNQEELHD